MSEPRTDEHGRTDETDRPGADSNPATPTPDEHPISRTDVETDELLDDRFQASDN